MAASALRGLVLAGLLLGAAAAHADAFRVCDEGRPLTVRQQDRELRFAAAVRDRLQASAAPVAVIARAGLDLERFGQRYSHAGLALREPASEGSAPWAVRQLYFDCEAGRPRLFDQGLAAFVRGADRPDSGFIAALLLPPDAAQTLERAARDLPTSRSVLHPRYSANAHAWSLLYQNCNQWVIELIARALDAGAASAASDDTHMHRQQAQAWLRDAGYEPAVFQLSPWMLPAAAFVPWLRQDDHPAADLEALQLRITMPASIEAFLMGRWPATQRLEFCQGPTGIVVREGPQALDRTCEPTHPGDTFIPWD